MGYYVFMCWKCGKAILTDFPLGRTMTCPQCGADLRSCKNCRFYSVGSWHDCAERSDELVKDKEKANFCDQFQLNPAFRTGRSAGSPGTGCTATGNEKGKPSASRAAFDDLFKS